MDETTLTPKEALIVFAKAPIAGQVKTRLIGALTPEQAMELYVCFLRDTFAMMEEVQEEREQCSLVLCYAPADELEAFEIADLDGCSLLAQEGQDLGERLQRCCLDLFGSGFQRLVIIGADSPTLPPEIVMEAFDQLNEPDHLMLGPATDGGYYLLGLTRPHPGLFAGINWGTENVFEQTQTRAQEIGLQVTRLPIWEDVDTPDDLTRLQEKIAAGEASPKATSRWLKKLHKNRS